MNILLFKIIFMTHKKNSYTNKIFFPKNSISYEIKNEQLSTPKSLSLRN